MNEKLTMGVRILFGAFMLIFGINKFLNFIPMPPIEGDGGTLMGIYFTSGFLKIIGVLEVLGGISIIINKYLPLSLIFMIAIMFNALIFHVLHDMAGIGGSAVALAMGLYLVYANKERFNSILTA